MSNILLAIVDGKAKEFKAVVRGSVKFVVELNDRFYIRSSDRFVPVAKKHIKTFVETSAVLN